MRKPFCLVIVFACIIIAAAGCTSGASESRLMKKAVTDADAAIDKASKKKISQHALAAATYVRQHHYNTRFCFLVDMSRPSGANRFFVYNLEKDSLEIAGLVAHGRCNERWLEGRKYSNVSGGGCTSLGKYKIGAAYSGQFGLAYKLYGLDTSNNNAFSRYVVLHSHTCVPVSEVNPEEICQSDGCPTVSPVFLTKLAKKLDNSTKPVLLWIYE